MIAADPQTALQHLVDQRFGMFLHFNMGTFTDEEWASPNQDPLRFAPTGVHCGQWAAAAAAARMSYGVLTAKHHDGFCLWPSEHTDYTVANSSYRQDIVEQYVTAFRAAGLKVGLYFSIWDRTHPVQAHETRMGLAGADQFVRPGDITFVLDQITELLTGYGPIDLFITDGYAWQMGQQAVPYQRIREHVKSLQPGIVMIDHGGLTVPFVGDAIYFEEPIGVTAPAGNTYAGIQGQTISEGWFWHPSTPNEELLGEQEILARLTALEANHTSLLLNCPPNRDGLLDVNIVSRLCSVGTAWPGPDLSRPPLPPQPPRVEHPITAIAAHATGFQPDNSPLHAINGLCCGAEFETCWSTEGLPLPQSITLDLGGVWREVSALECLPRQGRRTGDGDVTACTIATSVDGVTFTEVATATWPADHTLKFAEWPPGEAGYVRIEVTEATGGHATIAELRVGGRTTRPTLVATPFSAHGAVYRLVAHDDTALESTGAEIRAVPQRDHPAQQWAITPAAGGYHTIRNVDTGAPLSVPGQHWAITPTGDGHHLLINRFSGKLLTLDRGPGADRVHQWTYTAAAQQQWRITAG